MAKAKPDYSMVRQGRDLQDWLPELVSLDPDIRNAAADVIGGIWHGLPTMSTDWADVHPFPDTKRATIDFNKAVRDRVDRFGPDRAAFVRKVVAQKMAIAGDWLEIADQMSRGSSKSEAREDRLLDTALNSPDPEARKQAARRYGRLLCASCERDQKLMGQAMFMQPFGMVTGFVLDALSEALIDADDLLIEMLDSRTTGHDAYRAITRIGRPGRRLIPAVLERLDQTEHGWFEGCEPLASIGAGDPGLCNALLSRLSDDTPAPVRNAAMRVIELIGPDLAGLEHLIQERLHAWLRDDEARLAAIRALGSVGREDPRIVQTLVEYAKPKPARPRKIGTGNWQEQIDGVMYERGAAIDALAYCTGFPELAIPVLIEALGTFEEYDPDMTYGGEQARVCETLAAFGANASPAIDKLGTLIDRHNAKPSDYDFPKDALHVLRKIGPESLRLETSLERLRQISEDPEDEDAYSNEDSVSHLLYALRKAAD